ncbi:MraY family glycosyltransferase [Aridibaculum aurantiacum]|uniref:MraY family glycosyltransferase n=1 Tax=Aridibaculum aurantiacum TaxID=2810307 RepID=UPI001A96359A|nr:MraY family glycosyltransferase [Aridibaculum aurantiacum]
MEQIILGGIIAFALTFYSIPVIIKVANEKKLYDVPDDKRKIHTSPIPSLGGLGMFIGFTVSLLLTYNFVQGAPEFQYYLAAFLVIFFVGIKDDILILSAGKKFIGQLIVSGILIFKANLVITNMQGFMGINEIPVFAQYLLTMFASVVIINAFNLIDGVDGLAGTVGAVTSLLFGTFFLLNGNYAYATLGFTFSGAIIAFLYYNFNPAKIFMGDTGSLLIGLVNTILVIKFIETGATYTAFPITAAPAVGFGILLIPLMDTLRVFGMRIMKGKSPFSPDRNHIHHLLLDRGFNHKGVTYTCGIVTLLVAASAYFLQFIGTTNLIFTLIAGFFGWVYTLYIRRSRFKLRVIKGDAEKTRREAKSIRLVSLANHPAAVAEEE